ncbi:LOW QUALITY PROTEIN: V-type immunoglobulin domain-containing suppressor of T-cell activation [Manacus vitellinus]|uniref:LOW QUALITY PROTEIN: V-type immunoglobulin domain-containing suppressor of T-cell activation n=1 Tax=Manacus vitellinus TaxID=328815 RepID=UPI00115E6F8A|nr:LOW QUALITY PROTEIN: V-type immunoglobulin domain-containing suppressor of T-cell activation [Manacus vitellinus]
MGVTSPRTRLLLAALCLFASHGGPAAFLITTRTRSGAAPRARSVTLSCRISGLPARPPMTCSSKTWYFSSTGDQSLLRQEGTCRNVTEKELHHDLGRHHEPGGNSTQKSPLERHHGVEFVPDHHGAFHIVVMNLTLQDSGNYCCYAAELRREHGKPHTMQVAHGFVELQIQQGRGGLQNCTFHTATSKDITAAALATGACIVGILCLPLILLLIYKQRQAATNRRAHELVRMDSSAQGIENPVFEAVPSASAEPRPRPQLSYMASRLPSESGRHLLSEPSTPLSPPGPGECFFPTLDPVPDSPNSLKA